MLQIQAVHHLRPNTPQPITRDLPKRTPTDDQQKKAASKNRGGPRIVLVLMQFGTPKALSGYLGYFFGRGDRIESFCKWIL